jgi:vacuolar protein sorting-associated protein 1
MLREKDTCKKILEDIVSAETGYLFTNDSKYLMEHASMLPMNQQQRRF